MTNIKATRVNAYTKVNKNGGLTKMHVYKLISGTPEQLADYAKCQGVNYRVDNVDGRPLYHSPQFYGTHIELVKGKSKVGDVLVDAYRPMSNEDFELKAQAYERQANAQIAPIAVSASVNTIEGVDMSKIDL